MNFRNFKNGQKPDKIPGYVYYIIVVLVIILINTFVLPSFSNMQVQTTDYTTFLDLLEKKQVKTAEVQDAYIYYTAEENGQEKLCRTVRMEDPSLVDRLYEAGAKMEAVAPQRQSLILSLLIGYVVPILIFIFLGRWLSKKMMESMGGAGG